MVKNMTKEIAIISSGFLPIPATKGGAVENLIENLLKENEKNIENLKFIVLSVYDLEAQKEAEKYKNVTFKFIKIPYIIKLLDKILYFIAKKIFLKKKLQSYRYILQRLYYLNKVSLDLKKNNYNKIILENHPTQFLSLKWRKNYKKYVGRYYYHCHNEFSGTYGCSKIIIQTHKFICVSKFIAKSLQKYLNIDKNKFVILKNSVNNDFFKKVDLKEKQKLLEKYDLFDKKILLFTGRIIPEKGIKELLSALKLVKYKNFKLLVLGASLNELKVKTTFEEMIDKKIIELQDKVIFTGYIPHKNISDYYAIADIAVLPSIWDDPAPLTIIESLASGVPLITTNSGGIPEYATSNSAIILKRNDQLINEIAKSIDLLLTSDDIRNKMAHSAKKDSISFSTNNYFKNFKIIIED